MRYISCLVLACMVFSGCNSIKVREDSFKNSTVVTMEMDHRAHIDGFTMGICSNGSMYSREIKDGQKLPAVIYFKLPATVNITSLSNEAYIKVDGSNTKLSFEYTGVQTGVNVSQSTSMNYTTGKLQNSTDVTSLNVLLGRLSIPLDVEESILKAKNVQYRLYFNNDPIDLTVTQNELTKVKQFFRTTGKKKQS